MWTNRHRSWADEKAVSERYTRFVRYSRIDFGNASAELESANTPRLLIEGYLDAANVTRLATDSERFLFLGYKGSGKTALGQRLKLLSEAQPELFVRDLFLADLPYPLFLKLAGGDEESAHRVAWAWILLAALLDSFEGDHGATRDPDYEKAVKALRKLKLLPVSDLSSLATASTSRTVKLSLPMDFGIDATTSAPEADELLFLHLVDYLRRVVQLFKSNSRHIIVVDGLDDVLVKNAFQYHSLMALVSESMRLNLTFRRAGLNAKIIVLCRTDLFERLTGPNKNKLRQDAAFEFDWYHDSRQPMQSGLVRMANLRADLLYPNVDIFSTFFPREIDGTTAAEFLLRHTRHTPRDFLQLLKHIQRYDAMGRLTRAEVLSGIRDYSINYFMPEIRDELGGHVDGEIIDNIFSALFSVRRRQFYVSDVEATIKAKRLLAPSVNLRAILELLYECSAIGQVTTLSSGKHFFYWKYRTRHSSFNPDERITFHQGLWKALNIV